MKISIAMATYNGAKYLPEQLKSFADQTRLPDELVITDDGSTDATEEIVRAFAGTVPFPVRFERNPANLGVLLNFDRALSLCTGDLVFLSDQDDVWLKTKLEEMIAVAEARPDLSCFMNDTILTDGDLVTNGLTKMGNIREAGLPATEFVMGCCTLVRRRFLDAALPIPARMPKHDSWLIALADLLEQNLRVERPLQYFRRHGANDSSFFVNNLAPRSPVHRLKLKVSTLRRRLRSSANADRELLFLETLSERLRDRREACAGLVGADRLDQIATRLARRLEVVTRRRAIRQLALPARPVAITDLWRRGGYAVSGGASGMVKDFIGSP